MLASKSLILEIRGDCLNNSVSVVDILRKAKVAATKLDLDDLLEWVNSELKGYTCKGEELPEYRKVRGVPEARNSYINGCWQPIQFVRVKDKQLLSQEFLFEGMASLEKMSSTSGDACILFGDDKSHALLKIIGKGASEVRLNVVDTVMITIVNEVRDNILNWTLELEKLNILGEGMSFKDEDKKKSQMASQTITQNFYDSVNTTGVVNDQASVVNRQDIFKDSKVEELKTFVDELKSLIPVLPENVQSKVGDCTEDLCGEINKKSLNRGKVGEILLSLKNICEGVAGSIIAQGILSTVKQFGI